VGLWNGRNVKTKKLEISLNVKKSKFEEIKKNLLEEAEKLCSFMKLKSIEWKIIK
jgi:hypothetical protein